LTTSSHHNRHLKKERNEWYKNKNWNRFSKTYLLAWKVWFFLYKVKLSNYLILRTIGPRNIIVSQESNCTDDFSMSFYETFNFQLFRLNFLAGSLEPTMKCKIKSKSSSNFLNAWREVLLNMRLNYRKIHQTRDSIISIFFPFIK
jgi:hypothetical protein